MQRVGREGGNAAVNNLRTQLKCHPRALRVEAPSHLYVPNSSAVLAGLPKVVWRQPVAANSRRDRFDVVVYAP